MPTTVINQNGPLPLAADFQPEVTGPATLVVSGSVWTQKPNTMIGIEVWFDAVSVGKAKIFSNGPTTHRAVIPLHIPVMLDSKPWDSGPATYSVKLSPMNADTIGDKNDIYTVTLIP